LCSIAKTADENPDAHKILEREPFAGFIIVGNLLRGLGCAVTMSDLEVGQSKGAEESGDDSRMGYRILVVEDDAVTALSLQDVLRRLEHDVVGLASTGREAIRWAEAEQPDVILMDIWLAGPISGIEAASQIRQSLDIPVVFVTAHSDESTLRRAQATQPYGFVLKPFDRNDLRVAIEIAVHKHRIDAHLRRSEQRFATTLKAIGEAVISTDAKGRVDFINGAAVALAGVAVSEALGKPVGSFLKLVDPASRQPLAADQPWNGEAVLVDVTGRDVPIVGSITNISPASSEAAGQVMVLRDVTEDRRMAELRERQRVEQIMAEVSEAERRRFGQDLHDGLGQMLTGVAFLCKTLEQKLASRSQQESADAKTISKLLGDAIDSARELARGLLPVPAQPDGLVLALQCLADQITSQFQIECDFPASSVRISNSGTANHLFRIAQEAVNNAVKHASPQRIDISLQAAQAGTGCLSVKDNGRGISSEASGRGSGLDIMRHRAAAIGGSLRVSAGPGGGTVMTCFFPLKP
jgi:hypothetical protein